MFKRVLVSLLLVIITVSLSMPVSAASDSYTRVDEPGNITELRLSREMYNATEQIDAVSLGLSEKLDGITDMCTDDSGNIYLLCGDTSKLFYISADFTFGKEIVVTDFNGNKVDFKGAEGVYYNKRGNIYIADTANFRVLVMNERGTLEKVLEMPESDLIPEGFLYQPTSVIEDENGYIYVLSLGCYYGALFYTPEYEFIGFYGANTVASTVLDTTSYLWDKLTSNEIKKSSSIKKLPYSFTDFCFDPEGYLVTCTGSIDSSVFKPVEIGQIKKISPNGANILYKRELKGGSKLSSAVNFLESSQAEGTDVQEIVSVDVSKDNYIFALDRGNGTIYIYDSECNLMSAFGGGFKDGHQLGDFKNPVALAFSGNRLIVADSEKFSVTVFEPTKYGNLLRNAQSLYLKGNYEEAKDLWQDVLSLNRNCQLAYRGLAMVYYIDGDYEAALEAARISVDYSVYDLAWKEIVSDYIANHFVIFVIIILVITAVIFIIIYIIRRKRKKIINNSKIKLLLEIPFHPFNSFEDLKYKQLGSWKIAIILTASYYIASVLDVTSSGFLYSDTLLRNYNSLYTLASSAGLILLWSVCNWLVCSMFSGKGNFKEVYVATCYALLPWIVFTFLKIIFSQFLPLASGGLIAGIGTAVMLYTFFLLCIAMIKIHEYDFFKFILTGIVVILFMILVVFVILMCAILIMQFSSFIVSVYEEVAYR